MQIYPLQFTPTTELSEPWFCMNYLQSMLPFMTSNDSDLCQFFDNTFIPKTQRILLYSGQNFLFSKAHSLLKQVKNSDVDAPYDYKYFNDD